jgi:hypothetical protein
MRAQLPIENAEGLVGTSDFLNDLKEINMSFVDVHDTAFLDCNVRVHDVIDLDRDRESQFIVTFVDQAFLHNHDSQLTDIYIEKLDLKLCSSAVESTEAFQNELRNFLYRYSNRRCWASRTRRGVLGSSVQSVNSNN